jgi:CheY-like chemotaxis protein
MGGDIQVRSEVGRGSVFSFEVCLRIAMPKAPAGPLEAIPVAYQGLRKKLLVVDDIAENRAMLVDLLGPLGFEVLEAEDGQQGVQCAQASRPDAILMDSVMPVMDGLEATRRLRELERRDDGLGATPIITISASAAKADEEHALAAGATAFLSKPVRAAALLALLEQHLGVRFIYGQGPEPK